MGGNITKELPTKITFRINETRAKGIVDYKNAHKIEENTEVMNDAIDALLEESNGLKRTIGEYESTIMKAIACLAISRSSYKDEEKYLEALRDAVAKAEFTLKLLKDQGR